MELNSSFYDNRLSMQVAAALRCIKKLVIRFFGDEFDNKES